MKVTKIRIKKLLLTVFMFISPIIFVAARVAICEFSTGTVNVSYATESSCCNSTAGSALMETYTSYGQYIATYVDISFAVSVNPNCI